MNIKSMSLGPLGTNCYIVYNDQTALIVDPGGESNLIIDFLDERRLSAAAILLTHAHFDHIGAVDKLRTFYDIEVYLHEKEASWLENPSLNRSVFFTGDEIKTKSPEHILKPGWMEVGPFAFEVIHTPGHSPGSVSFVFAEDLYVISGDVLFQQGIGRTDLPGGDMKQLELSIRNHLYKLDDSFAVYPGHGPKTNIAFEKQHNPFFKEQ
ncbi:hypothetical protein CIL05_13935 [Virgibacillus profundi]|uniref:Metallo-beta-lactamase domain-containing protein n=1 Tax=Virgibacillus profundi TaxID=2024555 RepID=A0A2A2ID59_9BACI|nr:MBL fold metallo-hydrolase [Virgibacillus profundi]PAV29070.1 hypothetical protein CIL05_13935 [Virgibacillus profundi]PXY53239.1 MBL fold metallo-hydrolase [Virgibacillus profundi]